MTASGLGECLGGAIPFDGAIRRQKKEGAPFVKVFTDAGRPGIQIDTGARDMANYSGEEITGGLDPIARPARRRREYKTAMRRCV